MSLDVAQSAPATDFGAIHTWPLNGVIKIAFKSGTVPNPIVLPLVSIRGIGEPLSKYVVAKAIRLELEIPKYPSTDLLIVAAITGPTFPWARVKAKPTEYDTAECAGQLLSVPCAASKSLYSANTTNDSLLLPLNIPPGVAQSVIGVYPGLQPPTLSIAFASNLESVNIAAGTLYCTLRGTFECSGQGYSIGGALTRN